MSCRWCRAHYGRLRPVDESCGEYCAVCFDYLQALGAGLLLEAKPCG